MSRVDDLPPRPAEPAGGVAGPTTNGGDGYDRGVGAADGPSEEEEAYRRRHGEREAQGGGPAPAAGAEETALDLAELEQLHREAERMKGLGNKHMAAQEYTRAYNAYSAALQLSPVGPSSHVYLSNRAAALLSLKRYSAAAVDARRAVALAPAFGKAHARMGQALYFLKDYPAAVAAYEEAVRHEPDNTVTWTYLAKAQSKMVKEEEKRRRKERGEEVSIAVESMPETVVNSIATDPNMSAALVSGARSGGLRTSSVMMRTAIGEEFYRQPQRQPEPSPAAAAAASAAGDADVPPLEVRTGIMGPGGAQEKPQPPQSQHSPALDEEARSPQSEPSPRSLGEAYTQDTDIPDGENEDADFEEALRLQRNADHYLSLKQYRAAVEEYSAALFLVPDDANLSPLLHLGRAHALNGLKRHEPATNDCRMALSLGPGSREAYSVLAKSLFYAKDYAGAVEAFERSAECLQPGEEVSMFDQAYLEKAREALAEEERNGGGPDSTDDGGNEGRRKSRTGSVVPKLKPPRFVPREEVIKSQPNLRPMPKAWPQQNLRSPKAFFVGPEKEVVFLSEQMGIKLNRGSDGVVRVISVTPVTPGSPIARRGVIEVGDVVREAHGVDLRRPITNVMWGDTVALIKLAPRPVSIVFAKELSSPPPAVAEEMAKASVEAGPGSEEPPTNGQEDSAYESGSGGHLGASVIRPSPASGEEPVAESIAATEQREISSNQTSEENEATDVTDTHQTVRSVSSSEQDNINDGQAEDASAVESGDATGELNDQNTESEWWADREDVATGLESNAQEPQKSAAVPTEKDQPEEETGKNKGTPSWHGEETDNLSFGASSREDDSTIEISPENVPPQTAAPTPKTMRQSSKQEKEVETLGGEVLFNTSCTAAVDETVSGPKPLHEWTNERWLSTSSTRTLRHSGWVTRLAKGRFFWSGEEFVPRTLALFREPDLILVLRPPTSVEEVRKLLTSNKGELDEAGQESEVNLLHSYFIAESVIDPKTCKLRLSRLTTATSISESRPRANDDPKRRTCFELVTPSETITFSAVVRSGDEATKGEGVSYSDSTAYYETSAWEVAIAKALFDVHRPIHEALAAGNLETDQAWMHQVVLGTLHSLALSGDTAILQKALDIALAPPAGNELTQEERARILDGKDEFGQTALHYACARRLSAIVNLLVTAGADCSVPTLLRQKTPCHLCAEFLDEKSLSTILSASKPVRPDPNALDAEGRTPMYVASVEGKAVGGGTNSIALGLCLSALEVWGGQMLVDDNLSSKLPHPIHCAASQWRSTDLDVLFSHCKYLYPLKKGDDTTLGAFYHYPLHAALLSLRKKVMMVKTDGGSHGFEAIGPEPPLVSTLRVLLDHGLEVNERLEGVSFGGPQAAELNDIFGFTPIQVLAAAALETQQLSAGDTVLISSLTLSGIAECIAETAELLVKSGARISVDAPPTARLKRSSSSLFEANERNRTSLPAIDRSALKIDSNTTIIDSFGGDEKMRSARVYWSSRKPVRATPQIVVDENIGKESISNSDAPGGSDANSCALCWNKFGKLMKRKHSCRVSKRYVCEDCSSKRVVKGGKELRVSDGQYRVAVVEAEKRSKADVERRKENRQERKERIMAQAEAHRKIYSQNASESEKGGTSEEETRDELFSGAAAVASTVKNFILGEDEPSQDDSAESQLQGIAATLNQTKDAFNERGERLNSLSEKTAALKDASRDFAKMAKELNQKQQKGWW